MMLSADFALWLAPMLAIALGLAVYAVVEYRRRRRLEAEELERWEAQREAVMRAEEQARSGRPRPTPIDAFYAATAPRSAPGPRDRDADRPRIRRSRRDQERRSDPTAD